MSLQKRLRTTVLQSTSITTISKKASNVPKMPVPVGDSEKDGAELFSWLIHPFSSDKFFKSVLCDSCRARAGRNGVRWRPGQEASLAPPCSNLRSFGSKYTVLKEVFVTLLGLFGAPAVIRRPVNCAPIYAPARVHY